MCVIIACILIVWGRGTFKPPPTITCNREGLGTKCLSQYGLWVNPYQAVGDIVFYLVISRGSSKPHPLQHSPAVPPDEDSNSSWTSSSGRKKPRSHAHQSGVGNLIGRGGTGGGGEGGSRQVSREVSSDSEDDTRDRKKKTKVSSPPSLVSQLCLKRLSLTSLGRNARRRQ